MLRMDGAPTPMTGAWQAPIRVIAFSFNPGEVAFRRPNLPDGTVPGWDAACIVVTSAADGSGPATGSRVVTFGWGGAGAEFRAVDTDELAFLPGASGGVVDNVGGHQLADAYQRWTEVQR